MSRRGLEDWQFIGDPAPLARHNMYLSGHTVAL